MKLPVSKPIEDAEEVWALQLHLLAIAESLFGPRDPSRTLCQPQFDGPEPNVRFTLDERGVYAELSTNGRSYWPTVLYELAHETVHLLDPGKLGTANYLEEGIAVAFSVYAQLWYSAEIIQTPKKGSKYEYAYKLVSALPGPLLTSACRIRHDVGRFSAATSTDLVRLFPDVDIQLAIDLSCVFPVDVDS